MEGVFLIWKEANQAHRIQYETKAEQNTFLQGLNNMKILNSSATEEPKVSFTPCPPYLFSLIIFSFQVGDCAVKLTNTYKNHPPVLCGPPSFAAAALQVRAKIRRKLSFPAGVSSIPHSVDPDLPRCELHQCDKTLSLLHSSQLQYLPPSKTIWCAKRLPCQ